MSKWLRKHNNSATIRRTTSDNYFHNHSKAAITSKNIYSELVAPVISNDAHELINHTASRRAEYLASQHDRQFEQWLLEMQEGFNLILYGYGSKHRLLNRLAKRCSTIGDAIVVSSWKSTFNPEQILTSIGQSHGLDTESASRSLENRVQDILSSCDNRKKLLFLLVDSLDAPSLTSNSAKLILSSVSRHRQVRIVAAIANVKAAHGWNLQELTSRKQEVMNEPSSEARDGFARGFLWHDVTTFEEYHLELDGRNLAAPPLHRSGRMAAKAVLQRGTPITQTAAHHILASVTERAKKLFLFIASKQLEQRPPPEEVKAMKDMPSTHPLPYATTFISARDSFLAQSDTQMKALLSEFTDHGLIVLESGGLELDSPGEVLWISMDWDSLLPVVQELSSQLQG